jgi:hypothetical protein
MQAQETQANGEDAPPLVLARRLSPPSLGAASYTQQVKQALILLSQEYPEVQTAQAAAATSGYGVDAARQARYPRFKLGTSSGNYNSGADNAKTQSYTVLTAEARLSLLDGGAMSAAQRAAEAANQADDEAVTTTSQKVVLDALTAYLQVQRFDLKKQIAHKATEVVAELSKAEARRVALGVTGDNDLNMAASRRALVAARESDFGAQRDEAAAKFRNYFKFSPNPESLPVLAAPPQWRISSQDEALRRAESRSTEIAEAQGRIARARALADQQDASLYPTLDAVLVKSKDPRGVSPQDPTRAALRAQLELRQRLRPPAAAEVGIGRSRQPGGQARGREAQPVRAHLGVVGPHRVWARARTPADGSRQHLGPGLPRPPPPDGVRPRDLAQGARCAARLLHAAVRLHRRRVRPAHFRAAPGAHHRRAAHRPRRRQRWIDRLFGAPGRQVLTEDGLLGALCISSNTACASEPVVERTTNASMANPPLRKAPRIASIP